jgi:hypothetical protein
LGQFPEQMQQGPQGQIQLAQKAGLSLAISIASPPDHRQVRVQFDRQLIRG